MHTLHKLTYMGNSKYFSSDIYVQLEGITKFFFF